MKLRIFSTKTKFIYDNNIIIKFYKQLTWQRRTLIIFNKYLGTNQSQ
jgi:hypothetical protein